MSALVDRPLEEWAFSRALFRQDLFKSNAREKKKRTEKRKSSTTAHSGPRAGLPDKCSHHARRLRGDVGVR